MGSINSTYAVTPESFHESTLKWTLEYIDTTEKRFRADGKNYFIIRFLQSEYVVGKEILPSLFKKHKALGYGILRDDGSGYTGVLLNNADINHVTYIIGLTEEVKNNFSQIVFN